MNATNGPMPRDAPLVREDRGAFVSPAAGDGAQDRPQCISNRFRHRMAPHPASPHARKPVPMHSTHALVIPGTPPVLIMPSIEGRPPAMRSRPLCPNPWRILVPIVFLTVMSTQLAIAGRNANGALIVHTDDAVTYTGTDDYCATSFLPASCEAAVTRTDKDEDTPAVIWLLAAFPDTSSPAVTTIQFGIDHNLPPGEGYFERYGKCGELELPDAGWPETAFGNTVSFGTVTKTGHLFPFYWFAVYGTEGSRMGTCPNPTTGQAICVDAGQPPTEDPITRFGLIRWYAEGANACPSYEIPDGPMQFESLDLVDPPDFDHLHYVDPSHPTIAHLDPGADNAVSFRLAAVAGTPVVDVTVVCARTNDQIYHEILTLIPDGTVIGPLVVQQGSGMAKVVIASVSGAGYFHFRPQQVGVEDGEQHNGNLIGLEQELPVPIFFRFWVPNMAKDLQIDCATGSPYGDVILHAPDGQRIWDRWALGRQYEQSNISPAWRGAVWTLEIQPQVDIYHRYSYGLLRVGFRSEGSDQWWYPAHAFNPDPAKPVHAEFAPQELFHTDNGTTFYAPHGTDYGGQVAGSETNCACGAGSLILVGRHSFSFFVKPGSTKTVWLRDPANCDDANTSATRIEVRRESDPTKDFITLIEGQEQVLSVNGGATGEILHVRVMNPYEDLDVRSDAPGVVIGPNSSLSWSKCAFGQGTARTPTYTFFVPSKLATIRLSIECGRSEWNEVGQYSYRVHPQVRVILRDPRGEEHSFLTDAIGRLEIEEDTDGLSGRAWSFELETSDDASGLGISLALGDSLPPYVTWMGETRLYVPFAFPQSPRMMHGDPQLRVDWRVLPRADVYFQSLSACYTNQADICEVYDSPLDQVASSVEPATTTTRRMHRLEAGPWSQQSILNGNMLFYLLQRPDGLGEYRKLRPTNLIVPGLPQQFFGMDGPAGCCWSASCEECGDRIREVAALGFKMVGSPAMLSPVAFASGMYSEALLGCAWLFDGALVPDYGCVEEAAESVDLPGLLTLGLGSEPLDSGVDLDDLYEAAYRFRANNTRKPLTINSEPNLKWGREVRDLLEVAVEEQYVERGWEQSITALCELVTRIEEMKRNVRQDVPLEVHIQGAYLEEGQYLRADPDGVGAQALAALLMGVNSVHLFVRFHGGADTDCSDCGGFGSEWDMRNHHAELWTRLGSGLVDTIEAVRGWLNRIAPYYVRFGPANVYVPECQLSPVIYAAGPWLRNGEGGTWVVFANLGHDQQETVEVPWGDLHVPSEWSFEGVDSSVSGASMALPVEGEPLSCTLAPGAWYVAKFISSNPSQASESDTSGFGNLVGMAWPNPFSERVNIRLRGDPGGEVRGRIYSAGGVLVRDLGVLEDIGTVGSAIWDGTDARGNAVAGGVYFLWLGGNGRALRLPLVCVK